MHHESNWGVVGEGGAVYLVCVVGFGGDCFVCGLVRVVFVVGGDHVHVPIWLHIHVLLARKLGLQRVFDVVRFECCRVIQRSGVLHHLWFRLERLRLRSDVICPVLVVVLGYFALLTTKHAKSEFPFRFL